MSGRFGEINKQLRVNERIRVREVRLIDEQGLQVGIVPTRDASQRAREAGLDLIEVSPNAVPPVCRIMDYGKFKYEQAKREKDAHRKTKQPELRLIRVRPHIDLHDFEFKVRNARKFLADNDKVRIFVIFRSREFTHPEIGRGVLQHFQEALADVSAVEKPISMEGRMMAMILAPAAQRAAQKPPRPRPEKAPEAMPEPVGQESAG